MGQDNQLAKSGYVAEGYVTRSNTELEDMYRTSWIVDRVVNVVAEDMIRGGIEIRSQMEPDKIDELMRAVRSAGIPGRFSDAIKWSRLYGGALAVILIDGRSFPSRSISRPSRREGLRGCTSSTATRSRRPTGR